MNHIVAPYKDKVFSKHNRIVSGLVLLNFLSCISIGQYNRIFKVGAF